MVIEHQLRPLLAFFEAQTLATGICAAESDFEDRIITSPAAIERLDRAVVQLAPFLGFSGALTAPGRPLLSPGR